MLYLTRTQKGPDGIFGTLDTAGTVLAYTLEHAYLDPKDPFFYPKIPEGMYDCLRGRHILEGMTHDFETFEIQVRGHTGILFHPGNFNKDSSGCVLLGQSIESTPSGKILKNSDVAFFQFMKTLNGFTDFKLTVLNMYN